MMQSIKTFILLGLLFFSSPLLAQHRNHAGWLFLSHTQKVSSKFDILADVQMRSGDQFSKFNTLLLRTAANYNFNKSQAVAIGYANKNDWETADDGLETHSLEHRVYEQYTLNFDLENIEINLRGRFEQRFVKEEQFEFSQRLRAFISAQIPLLANDDFSRGWYAKLQNEVFLNVQHKDRVNNSLLDQNRPYAGFGYRFNKKIDMEAGYLRWLQREEDGDVSSNIVQLMVTTSF
jgi:hypothetical protein